MLRDLAILAVILSGAMLAGPAAADDTCTALFQSFRDITKVDPGNRHVHVYWLTSYRTQGPRMARYMGWTELKLYFRGVNIQDLSGSGTRTRKFDHAYTAVPMDQRGPTETVGLKIRADNKIVLSEIYGPYDATCSNAFPAREGFSIGFGQAVVHTGDSIEVFNFRTGQDR